MQFKLGIMFSASNFLNLIELSTKYFLEEIKLREEFQHALPFAGCGYKNWEDNTTNFILLLLDWICF